MSSINLSISVYFVMADSGKNFLGEGEYFTSLDTAFKYAHQCMSKGSPSIKIQRIDGNFTNHK